MFNFLKSRKYVSSMAMAALVLLNDTLKLGISENALLVAAGLVAAWIVGESFVDGKREE